MKVRHAVAVVAICTICFVAQPVMGQGNLFSQYTTQGANQVDAGMYPAPHPVPSWVGSSYYTYQPLQPHEMMYQHSRNYYNYYGGNSGCSSQFYGGYGSGGGLTKTSVRWQAGGSNHMGPLPGNMWPLSNFYNRAAQRRYTAPGSRSVGSHVKGKINRVHNAIHGFGSLGNHHGGGCASGDCGSESYDGDVYGGDIYGAAEGGCASGGCAVGEAPSNMMNR